MVNANRENTVVMKFGGTSVGTLERIENVAKKVINYKKATGDNVVVVVSAMSGETDRLVGMAKQINGVVDYSREYHQLVCAGEQVSCSLTAMAMKRFGSDSRALLASHIKLRTKNVCGQNLIDCIDADYLWNLLRQDIIPVVAGFQGVDETGDFTTLGRGGSDTTGVALAAALDSSRCIIYTDVDGVYTTLPSLCKKAKKLPALSYEEMLELASGGAKVLHARCVSLAMKYAVPLEVRSTFTDTEGTKIVEEYEGMEDAVVSGITVKTDEAKLTIRNIPDRPGIAARLFKLISEAGVVVDMIVQSAGQSDLAQISFTVSSEDAARTHDLLMAVIADDMPQTTVTVDNEIAKLSIVGEGMKNHAGIAAQMFEVLGREGINIDMITTSEIKVSVAINQKYSELAVRVLHEFFIENN